MGLGNSTMEAANCTVYGNIENYTSWSSILIEILCAASLVANLLFCVAVIKDNTKLKRQTYLFECLISMVASNVCFLLVIMVVFGRINFHFRDINGSELHLVSNVTRILIRFECEINKVSEIPIISSYIIIVLITNSNFSFYSW